MKDPSRLAVGQESVGHQLEKSIRLNKVHSCLKNKVDNGPDSSDGNRRKVRSVSFSFPSWDNDDAEDERDPPNEDSRKKVLDFWDDTEYSVSMDSRKSSEWIEVQLNQRYLCDKMLCGVGHVDTEIYNEGPLKDLELEPLGDYESLFFKEEDDDYSLSAKSGSTSPRKQVQGNELRETLTDDTDISLNAHSMHRVDREFNDSMDSDSTSSLSLIKLQHQEEKLLRFPSTFLGQVNTFLTSTENMLTMTSGTSSQMESQFPNLQENTYQSTDCSSLKKPGQTFQDNTTQSTAAANSSLDFTPHQTLQADSAQSTADDRQLETSVSSETSEYESGEEHCGVEWTLQEFRGSMMPRLSGCRYLLPPLPKPQQEQRAAANPAKPQEGHSPSQWATTVNRKNLLSFRRSVTSKQQEGDKKHQGDKMQPSRLATPSQQVYSAAQDATSTNGQRLNHESCQVSDMPLDTETPWKESTPAATRRHELDNDIIEKVRQENLDDIEPLDDASHTSSPTGFIPKMTEKNDGALAVQQDGSGSEWPLHSICCSTMLMPHVDSDVLSEPNECQENHHQQDENSSGLKKKCQENEDDEQQSTDPVHPSGDNEDDASTILLSNVSSKSFPSGFCCPEWQKEDEGDEQQSRQEDEGDEQPSTDPVQPIDDQEDDTNLPASGSPSFLSGFCYPNSHKEVEGGELQSRDPVQPIDNEEDDTNLPTSGSPSLLSGFCYPYSHKEVESGELQSRDPVQPIDNQEDDTNLQTSGSPSPLSEFCYPNSHKEDESGELHSTDHVEPIDDQEDNTNLLDKRSHFFLLGFCCPDSHKEDEGDEQQSTDPVQSINDQKDDTNLLDRTSPFFLSGFCYPNSHKEEEDPFLHGPTQATEESSMKSMAPVSSVEQQQDQRCHELRELENANVRGCSSASEEKDDEPIITSMSPAPRCDLSSSQHQGDQRGGTFQWLNPVNIMGCAPVLQDEKDCGSSEWAFNPHTTSAGSDLPEPQQGDQNGDIMQWLSHLTSHACNPPSEEKEDGGYSEWTTQGFKPIIASFSLNGVCDPSEPRVQESEEIGLVERIGQEFSHAVMSSQTVNSDQQCLASTKSWHPTFLPRACFITTTKTPLVPSTDQTEKSRQKNPCTDPTERTRQEDEDDIKMRDEKPPLPSTSWRGPIAKMNKRKFSQRGGDVGRKVKSMVKMFDLAHLQRQRHLFSISQSKKNVKPRGLKSDKEERQMQPCQVSDKSLGTDIPPTMCNDTTTPTTTPATTTTLTSCCDPSEIERKTSQEDVGPFPVETTILESLTGWSLSKMMGQESSTQQENDNGGRVKQLVQMFDSSNMTTPPLHRGDYILQAKSVDRQRRQQHQHQQQDHDNQVTAQDNSHWGSPWSTIRNAKSEGHESQVSDTWSLPIPTASWFVPYSFPTHQKEDDEQELGKEIAPSAPSLVVDEEEVPSASEADPDQPQSWMMMLTGAASTKTTQEQEEDEEDSYSISTYAYETLRDLVASTMPSLENPSTLPQDKQQKEEEQEDMDQVRIVGMSSNIELLSTMPLEMTQPTESSSSKHVAPCQENAVLIPQVSNEPPTKRKRRSSRLLGVVGSRRRLFCRRKKQQVIGR